MKEGELGRVYSDGETICREGEEGSSMFVIQSGEVDITRKSIHGDVVIAALSDGEIFGEMALFDRLPRSATATASGEARVLSVDKKKLFTLINRDPTLAFKILETMSQRIRKLDGELTRLKRDKLDIMDTSMDIDEMCKTILEEARRNISADSGSVMLLDEEEDTLSIRAAFGNESAEKVSLTRGKGIAGDVLLTGKAELINNVGLDSRFVSGKKTIGSILCVPLKSKGRAFGVINISNSAEKIFTISSLKALDSLAFFASLAIENAKIFYELKSATNEVLLSHATMLDMCYYGSDRKRV